MANSPFRVFLPLVSVALAGATVVSLAGQQQASQMSDRARAQIAALASEKAGRTAVQRKIDSRLLAEQRMRRRQPIAAGVDRLSTGIAVDAAGGVEVEVRGIVTDELLLALAARATIVRIEPAHDTVRIRATLDALDAIAARPDVKFVQTPARAITRRRTLENALAAAVPLAAQSTQGTGQGTVTSQGDQTHLAAFARSTYGVTGAGVRIGVLSDGVDGLAASQSSGNLPAVTVLGGQAGSGSEGTAMLEIIHDLAPGAQLYFATAFNGINSFASNIRALRAAGCDIIIDDVYYFVESPFQDGQSYTSQTNGAVVTQAVKDVTAAGALYFSSAGNSGNLDSGTSGTWEGDFVDGGEAGAPTTFGGRLHSFGGQLYNVLTRNAPNGISLSWADPLGQSANDYDLYVLDSSGSSVVAMATNGQTGSQDPFEYTGASFANERVVITKYSGSARFLHLSTIGGRLSIATAGETHGHATANSPTAFGVAATPAATPFSSGRPIGPYPNGYASTDRIETFSSDGPRRIFFASNGSAITPGNLTASGGTVLNKPDITAADGVSTSVPGFTTFYGTSAAAPHAGAIAALVKSANSSLTAAEIAALLRSTAIDIEGIGFDRNSGAGIVMATAAQSSSDAARLTAPLTITDATTRFTWNSVSGAEMYYLSIGSAPGTGQYHGAYTASTVAVVSGLPLNGGTIHARLWTLKSGVWRSVDHALPQADTRFHARLTLPDPLATLVSATTRFAWTSVAAADQYSISVGTGLGLADIGTATTTGLGATLSGIPLSGSVVYVRLGARVSGTTRTIDYAFRTADAGNAAVLTNPIHGTTIAAPETRFTWDRVAGAEMYWLDAGTTLGGRDLYNASAPEAAATIGGYALNGQAIYVRLWTLKGGTWRWNDYVFPRADASLQAVLTSPDPRGALTSATTTFVWRTLPAADSYWFEVGTAPGLGNLHSAETSGVMATVSNIPINGGIVYVRLWSRVSLTWRYVDYAFRTADSSNVAVLTTPAAVASIADATTRFAWNAVSGAEQYWLDVGTTIGARDVFAASVGLQATVSGIALNGQPLYVRLWTFKSGLWRYVDYVFARADASTQARLITPDRAQSFTSTLQPFTWTTVAGDTQYFLYLGTALGLPNIFNTQTGSDAVNVNNLALNGQPVYVRLWTRVNGGSWTYIDYVFNRGNSSTQALFNNIQSGAAFSASSFTFTWAAISGAEMYWLDAGTSPGARDVASQSAGTGTSSTISGMTLTGQKLYVRMWTKLAGGWSYVDYVFIK